MEASCVREESTEPVSVEEAAVVEARPQSTVTVRKRRTGPSAKAIKAVAEPQICEPCRLTFRDAQSFKAHQRRCHETTGKLGEYEQQILDHVMRRTQNYRPSATDVNRIVAALEAMGVSVAPAAVQRRFAAKLRLLSEQSLNAAVELRAVTEADVRIAVDAESGPDDRRWAPTVGSPRVGL